MSKSIHTEVPNKQPIQPFNQCFFITPISDEGTATRILTDGIIAAIGPILSEYGYLLEASHNISTSGSINDQVIDRLINDDLVIANLTDFNPNVMYELAVRHCAAKPVILIVNKGDKIPFDLQQERRIEYTNDIAGGESLKRDIRSAVDILVNGDGHLRYNPIYKVAKLNLIEKNVKPGENDLKDYIINGFRDLSVKFDQLTSTTGIHFPENPILVGATVLRMRSARYLDSSHRELSEIITTLPDIIGHSISLQFGSPGRYTLTIYNVPSLLKMQSINNNLREAGFEIMDVNLDARLRQSSST